MKHSKISCHLICIIAFCSFHISPLLSYENNDGCPGNLKLIQQLNSVLTEAIVHDGFSPPVASRIYAYCNVAGYESVYFTDSTFLTLSGQLNGFALREETAGQFKLLNSDVALITAFCNTAVEFVYRDFILQQFQDSVLKSYKLCLNENAFNQSVRYGEELSKQIVAWAAGDGYRETRNLPKFRPKDTPESWKPTPPMYGDAAEPWWMKIRPFVLDSSGVFRVKDPIPFSTEKSSDFYRQALATLNAKNQSDSEQTRIATFWDCNPQKTNVKGHLMFTTRQLTPGGHWMGVAGTACGMKKLSLAETAETYALTSIAIADGFINCWHEKYRTDLIRPETYINLYIDKLWRPMLETPLFPEHPSGHSVISAAASEVLTAKLGENFAFTDSTEIAFGQGVRSFSNFEQAADEAAISRVYGGIHYPHACNEGIMLGEKIGRLVLEKIKTRK